MAKVGCVVFALCAVCWPLLVQACPEGRIESGVPGHAIQEVVDKHNALRLLVARGQLGGQPRGVNLKRMRWDDSLAQQAQHIADSCNFAHVAVHDGRFAVGQNLWLSYSSGDGRGTEWSRVIQGWFDEHSIYRYPNGFSTSTGHYTQVVWADTFLVGCGYTMYHANNQFNKLYVCNYGPAGNFNNRPPYNTGGGGCENLC